MDQPKRRATVKTTPVTTRGTRLNKESNVVASKFVAPQIKKSVLVNTKVNPSSIKIRSNPVGRIATNVMPVPVSNKSTESSSSSTDTTFKISGHTTKDPIKAMPHVAAGVDADEDILDELYTMYLQRRLLAQYAHKKMRQQLDRQTDSATTLFLQKELIQKRVFEARFDSLRKIEKQVAQQEKLKPLEENLDLLLELILANNAEQAVQNFEDKLAVVGDTLRMTNSNSSSDIPNQQINLASIEEAYQELRKSTQLTDSAVNVIENLSTNLETLQILEQTSACEEKVLNEKIIQLSSMKVSQELLDTQPVSR